MEDLFWISIMGGHRTPSGPWRPDRNNVAVSIMGGQQLDFTQAVFDESETRLYVVVLLGGARITVPRGIDVVVEGINIMGGRRVETAMPLEPSSGPRLRITALVALGGLRVRTTGWGDGGPGDPERPRGGLLRDDRMVLNVALAA